MRGIKESVSFSRAYGYSTSVHLSVKTQGSDKRGRIAACALSRKVATREEAHGETW